MKNVLIIAYYWGTRIPGLVKYLPEFGWQPVILTAPLIEKPNTQFRVVETSYRDVLSFWKRLLLKVGSNGAPFFSRYLPFVAFGLMSISMILEADISDQNM